MFQRFLIPRHGQISVAMIKMAHNIFYICKKNIQVVICGICVMFAYSFEYNKDKVSKMTELKQVTFQDIGVSKTPSMIIF